MDVIGIKGLGFKGLVFRVGFRVWGLRFKVSVMDVIGM
jgi:hypothetical protein